MFISFFYLLILLYFVAFVNLVVPGAVALLHPLHALDAKDIFHTILHGHPWSEHWYTESNKGQFMWSKMVIEETIR